MTDETRVEKKQPRRKRWGWRIFGLLLIGVIVGWFGYATVGILNPTQGQTQTRSDAVVSLAPQLHRLPMAEQLVTDGVADTLAISYFDHDPLNQQRDTSDGDELLSDYCQSEASHRIVCFTPEEAATIGEAYAVGSIAREHAWKEVTVVTNTTHVFRTRYIFNRCLGGDLKVNVVFADREELTAAETAWFTVYENAAVLKAFVQATWRC